MDKFKAEEAGAGGRNQVIYNFLEVAGRTGLIQQILKDANNYFLEATVAY